MTVGHRRIALSVCAQDTTSARLRVAGFVHVRAGCAAGFGWCFPGPQVVYIDFGLSQAFARKVENITGTSLGRTASLRSRRGDGVLLGTSRLD